MNYGKGGAILPITGLAVTDSLWVAGAGAALVVGGLLVLRLVGRKAKSDGNV